MARRPASYRGAVGDPGDRTFFIEVEASTGTLWFLLEKAQVAALSIQSTRLLRESGVADPEDVHELEPVRRPSDDVEFRVGEVRLAYTESTGLVTLMLFSRAQDDSEPVEFTLTPAQLATSARFGAEAVTAGRPSCARCGLAKDPEGHACPADNGDLRTHRP